MVFFLFYSSLALAERFHASLFKLQNFPQIMELDELPQHICAKCEDNAILSYSFRLKCEESERILYESLQQFKIDIEYGTLSTVAVK